MQTAGPDWGPVVVAVAMFILLSPGLLFQLPARTRVIEFGNMYTSGISILVHAILYFYELIPLKENHISPHRELETGSAGVDVDVDGEDENSVEGEEDERVDGNSLAVGLHASELQLAVVPRYLKQQPRLQQYEEYNSDEHRAPVSH
ncbi:hypothetical protein STAS_24622 [Striga asiatica]|uniref:Uncharacterized protein n=1 Tax=Striga asiatica TaxID=4170 RepID=A0A5A7QQI9_STRAF|nr:hypothetical protein STAS_24622 [Striga asiatica]